MLIWKGYMSSYAVITRNTHIRNNKILFYPTTPLNNYLRTVMYAGYDHMPTAVLCIRTYGNKANNNKLIDEIHELGEICSVGYHTYLR